MSGISFPSSDPRPRPLAAGGSAAEPAVDARAARAVRDFQSLLLRELLRPLTDAIGQPAGGEETGLGLSSGNDVYNFFWSEALSQHLAGAWPMPSLQTLMPGNGDAGSTAGQDAAGMSLLSGPAGASLAAARAAAAATAGSANRSADGNPIVPTNRSTHRNARRAVDAATAARSAGVDEAAAGPLQRAGSGDLPRVTSQAAEASALAVSLSGESATGGTAAAAAGGAGASGIDALAVKAARLNSLPANLVRAVMKVESNGRTDAVSPRGAVGLMQLMPATAKELGVRDSTDAWQNLVGGARYLARQVSRFGRLDHALAAYNAGPGAVEKHSGVPPYRETRAYVQKVMAEKARLDRVHPEGA